MSVVINGFCDSRFQRLADIFETNFKDTGEVGASMAITREGETVVDLWGGSKTRTAVQRGKKTHWCWFFRPQSLQRRFVRSS